MREWSVVLLLVASSLLAQDAPTPWQLLAAKDYPGYLRSLDSEIGGQTPERLRANVLKLSAVAISLERTKGWDQATGEQAARHVREAPDAKRYFDAFHKLLTGDVTAADAFFEGGPPPAPAAWVQLGDMLAYHGCDQAAAAVRGYNALSSGPMPFMPDQNKLRLAAGALASLAPADRTELLGVLRPRLERIEMRLGQFASVFSDYAMAAPEAQAGAWIDLALEVQPAATASALTTALQLARSGKPAAGLAVAAKAVQAGASDPDDLLALLREVPPAGLEDAFDALYRAAIVNWKPPRVHDVRRFYIRFLNTTRPAGVEARVKELGALAECDLLALRTAPEATKRYEALALDATQDAGSRWDAWGSWLAAAPGAAVKSGPNLPATGLDVPDFRWVIDQLRSSLVYGVVAGPPVPGPRPAGAAAADAVRKDAGVLADVLLRAAPEKLLASGSVGRYGGVRPELAALLALGGRVDQAVDLVGKAPAAVEQQVERAVDYLRAARAPAEVQQRFDALLAQVRKRP